MELLEKYDPEIFEYIKEIASKMKHNRASVMVGAGFSKNAKKITQTDKTFLDWNALGDVFFEKVNGHRPDRENQYLNVLKLAEEVEAAYGRTVLNQLIRDSLPDDEYVPSELHEKLLNLGWKDVFTTNYDTLLERTLEKVTERHYSVILNKEDLIYSSDPRIIKLHGSFPSTLPFVITEEDYRQYPKKSAIFVNTVQQTLIENVLCLVGFSGDDPNFLQWIGWIRDNIGKDIASKIYLVGVFKFSTAQLNLLNSRNIVVLNMSRCPDIKSNDHYAGLELFFDALKQLTKEKDEILWPTDQFHYHFDFNETNVDEKVKTIINDWAASRNDYPGWLVVPSDRRKTLLMKTDHCHMDVFYHIQKGHLSAKIAFDFLYEYDWRINKCLKPILRNEIGLFEKVLFSINPFSEIFSVKADEQAYDKEQPDWRTVSQKWIDLYIDLLRAYRENGLFDKFNTTIENIEKISQYLGAEQSAKIHCEKVRQKLFELNIAGATQELKDWPRNVSLPAFEIQRAGLLIELGDISQALKVLSEELSYIRKGPVKDINYFRISTEAYLVRLISYAKQALRDFDRTDEDVSTKKLSKLYDVYAEIEIFEALLKERPEKKYETEEYDINRVTHTIAYGDKSYEDAFQFVRFFEEIGSPFNANHIVSGNKACMEAIDRINPYSPLWSLILQIKVNDDKLKNKVWSRETISQMSNQEIDDMAKLCIAAVKSNLEFIEEKNHFREANFQLGIASVIPELLSRLCSRMSDEMKLQTLELLDLIYRSKTPSNFKNLKHLAKRLIGSMSEKLKIENFNALMKTYLYQPTHEVDRLDFADIFESFNYYKESEDKYKSTELDEQITEILFQLLEKEDVREIALTRLVYLYSFGLLTPEEISAFQKNIWSHVESDGLPKIPNIYSKKYILDLPHPENIDVHALIKKYILALGFPKETKGVTTSSSYNKPLFLLELETCSSSVNYPEGVKWTVEEFDNIICKILEAWKHDISLLSDKDKDDLENSELFEKIVEKYSSVDDILAQIVISSNISANDNTKLKELLSEFEKYEITSIQLKLVVKEELDAFDTMYDIICGSDLREINAACEAVYTAVGMQKNEHKEAALSLLRRLSLNVRIRRPQGLSSVMHLFYNLFYSDLLTEDKEIIDNLLFGLEHLLHETRLSNNTLGYTTNQCLRLRSTANLLAYIIYKKFEDNEKITAKLLPWKNLSSDLTEFSEVRNKWINT